MLELPEALLQIVRGENEPSDVRQLALELSLLARLCPQTWGRIVPEHGTEIYVKAALLDLSEAGRVEFLSPDLVRYLPPRPVAVVKQGGLFDGA